MPEKKTQIILPTAIPLRGVLSFVGIIGANSSLDSVQNFRRGHPPRSPRRGSLGSLPDLLDEMISPPNPIAVPLDFERSISETDIPIAFPIYSAEDPPATSDSCERYAHQCCPPSFVAQVTSSDPIFGIFGNHEAVSDRYNLKDILGEGMLGVVRRCVEKSTGAEWACKTIKKCQLVYSHDVEALRKEVAAMLVLSEHVNIVSLHDVVEDDTDVHLIMELCKGGELFDAIGRKIRYPERDAACVIRAVVSAMHYMHSKGLMHRDLKPENIILVDETSYTSVRVVDFGQVERFSQGQKLSQCTGSSFYISPDVLAGSYGPETDMWSTGVILYCLLSGRAPFWGEGRDNIFAKIKKGQFDLEGGPWKHVSDEAKDLIRRMLTMDPRHRITPAQVKKHPWILKYCTPKAPAGGSPPPPPALHIPPTQHPLESTSPVSVFDVDSAFATGGCLSPIATHLRSQRFLLPSAKRGAGLAPAPAEIGRIPTPCSPKLCFSCGKSSSTVKSPELTPNSPQLPQTDRQSRSPKSRAIKLFQLRRMRGEESGVS